jgi:hypothetical protein
MIIPAASSLWINVSKVRIISASFRGEAEGCSPLRGAPE